MVNLKLNLNPKESTFRSSQIKIFQCICLYQQTERIQCILLPSLDILGKRFKFWKEHGFLYVTVVGLVKYES